MDNFHKPDRRAFITAAGTALAAAAAVQFLGCGTEANNFGDGFSSNENTSPAPGDKEGSIVAPSENNHPLPGPHFAIIKRNEISNGQLLILSIKGEALHDHTISLSAADLADINNGKRVSKTSTDSYDDNGVVFHYHTVTYN